MRALDGSGFVAPQIFGVLLGFVVSGVFHDRRPP
jgi:hypothetical protein